MESKKPLGDEQIKQGTGGTNPMNAEMNVGDVPLSDDHHIDTITREKNRHYGIIQDAINRQDEPQVSWISKDGSSEVEKEYWSCTKYPG